MIREIIWKEWRENRWKYVSLWLVFNAPILILALALALSSTARAPFVDLSDQTVMKYLPLALGEGFMVTSIFLLATALVAVATFLSELDYKVFFVFEQAVPRRRYAVAKMFNGALQVGVAVCVAILLAPAAVYGMMLMGGKATLAGSGAAFSAVMAASARTLPLCCLFSLVAFVGSALIAVVVRRWWVAMTAAALFVLGFAYVAWNENPFFKLDDFFEAVAPGKTMSVSAGLGSGAWLKVSDVFPMPTGFAMWHWQPIATTAALIALFSVGLTAVYNRKELK
jgi:hypothetical protein